MIKFIGYTVRNFAFIECKKTKHSVKSVSKYPAYRKNRCVGERVKIVKENNFQFIKTNNNGFSLYFMCYFIPCEQRDFVSTFEYQRMKKKIIYISLTQNYRREAYNTHLYIGPLQCLPDAKYACTYEYEGISRHIHYYYTAPAELIGYDVMPCTLLCTWVYCILRLIFFEYKSIYKAP